MAYTAEVAVVDMPQDLEAELGTLEGMAERDK